MAQNMTCEQMLGPDKKPTLFALQIANVSKIIECLPELTFSKFGNEEALFIWQSIVEHYEGHRNVPVKVLATLKWVTPVISAEEYANLSLSEIDVVRNFGLDYNLSGDQLLAIADRVRVEFGRKRPEDYTCYDLIALRNILCAFNDSYIEKIHASAYKNAAEELATLECGPEVMSALGKLAVHEKAFGPQSHWNEDVKDDIGKVAKYLPKGEIRKSKIKRGLE